jgi:hypothetical protein
MALSTECREPTQLGQPVQGFCGHGPGGYVAVEHDGVDTSGVDVIKGGVERRQVAMNVGQHSDPHQEPSRFRLPTEFAFVGPLRRTYRVRVLIPRQ